MYHALVAMRKENKQNQEDVAKILKISKSSYAQREQGKKNFTLPEALKLSEYYRVPVEKLFKQGLNLEEEESA